MFIIRLYFSIKKWLKPFTRRNHKVKETDDNECYICIRKSNVAQTFKYKLSFSLHSSAKIEIEIIITNFNNNNI